VFVFIRRKDTDNDWIGFPLISGYLESMETLRFTSQFGALFSNSGQTSTMANDTMLLRSTLMIQGWSIESHQQQHRDMHEQEVVY
jgi:hypothetical protein